MTITKLLDLIQTSELHFTRLDQLEDPYEAALQKAACRRTPREAETVYVNCWFLSQYESAAMWSIFGGDNGVAVRSSRGHLGAVLEKSIWMEDLGEISSTACGPVRYLDDHEIAKLLQETGDPPQNTIPTFNKRVSFRHEQEVRLAIGLRGELHSRTCLRYPVDLNSVIDQIFVSPTAPTWIAEVTRRVVAKYGLTKNVVHSNLLSLTLT